jgi:thiamine-monophosphate kinase
VPRVALGQRLRGIAAAAIDVSDGLLADLGHVLERSKVAAEVDFEALPRSADLRACANRTLADECLLAGGDDYELVFTAGTDKRAAVEAAGRAAGVPVTRIGSIVAGAQAVRLLDRAGRPLDVGRRGFDHFR